MLQNTSQTQVSATRDFFREISICEFTSAEASRALKQPFTHVHFLECHTCPRRCPRKSHITCYAKPLSLCIEMLAERHKCGNSEILAQQREQGINVAREAAATPPYFPTVFPCFSLPKNLFYKTTNFQPLDFTIKWQ